MNRSRRRRRFKSHFDCNDSETLQAANEWTMVRYFAATLMVLLAIFQTADLTLAYQHSRYQQSLGSSMHPLNSLTSTLAPQLPSGVSKLDSSESVISIAPISQSQSPPPVSNYIKELCSQLSLDIAKQLKLCKLIGHSSEARSAVAAGAAKGLEECRNQFSSEKWNCTHSQGENNLLTGDFTQSSGNKESGFIHAITAAGIVHSIATACSMGSLSDCACDKTRIGVIPRQQELWKWGGCSDNIRYGMLFAKHLVELLDAVHQTHSYHHHQHHNHAQPLESRSIQASLNPKVHQNHHKSMILKRSLRVRHQYYQQLEATQSNGNEHHGHSSHHIHVAPESIQTSHASKPMPPIVYCQKDHNIAQSTHMQLIKSLLAKNSLEKHHEFRLAMNMHNNKVGRMVSN